MNLLDSCIEVYQSLEAYDVDERRRMAAVIREIASAIRAMAPPEDRARICHLAVNEVADHLIKETYESPD
jgi:hypothetical protein